MRLRADTLAVLLLGCAAAAQPVAASVEIRCDGHAWAAAGSADRIVLVEVLRGEHRLHPEWRTRDLDRANEEVVLSRPDHRARLRVVKDWEGSGASILDAQCSWCFSAPYSRHEHPVPEVGERGLAFLQRAEPPDDDSDWWLIHWVPAGDARPRELRRARRLVRRIVRQHQGGAADEAARLRFVVEALRVPMLAPEAVHDPMPPLDTERRDEIAWAFLRTKQAPTRQFVAFLDALHGRWDEAVDRHAVAWLARRLAGPAPSEVPTRAICLVLERADEWRLLPEVPSCNGPLSRSDLLRLWAGLGAAER